MRKPHVGGCPFVRSACLGWGADPVIRYILKQIVTWMLMVFAATNITYFLANWFLDPRSNYAERRPPLPEAQVDQMLAAQNLNDKDSIFSRWWEWLTDILLHWDWGTSPVGQSVNEQVSFRIWISLQLVLGATIVATLIGIALGVYTASRQYKLVDHVFNLLSLITLNIPIVVAGLFVVLLGIKFNEATDSHALLVAGSSSVGVEGFFPVLGDRIQHLILPSIAIVLTTYASTHILQRVMLLDTIGSDFVRTARAKGLTKSQAIRKHALRTSLIPVMTGVAFTIPALFTGAVLTETIFGWEGMGRYFVTSINTNDVHGVVAVAAFGAFATAVGAIMADVALVFLDPRVRVS